MSVGRITRAFVVPVCSVATVALLLSGCGDAEEPADTGSSASTSASATSSSTTTEAADDAATVPVAVALVQDEHVTLARVDVEPPDTARGALEVLLAGPGEAVGSDAMSSEIPDGTRLLDLAVEGGHATVDLSGEFVTGGGSLSMQLRAAQVVLTLTQFDTVDRVSFRIDGEPVEALGGEGIPAVEVDRSDFREVTPLVLVTSPLPGTGAVSPLTVEGISNTFEATVLYELLGPDGSVLDEGFTTATATSGSGTWGEFSFQVAWEGEVTGTGTLVAYQENMESGGRQDVHEVPIEFGT